MTVDSKPKYLPETYSPLELERLKEFRSQLADLELADELKEDAYLIRWLRARNLDVQKAYDMLKLSLEWRKENKVDGILEREDVPQEVQQQTPYAQFGVDKDGYPIILMNMGRQDGRALLEKFGMDECYRFHIINCEKIMRLLQNLSKEQGRPVTQLVQIIDLEGYNYRQLTSKLCREFTVKMQTMMDANYPEILRYCLVINAPKIFYILFNLLKPFIPKQTLDKVDIYGPEPEKWKKVITEKFPLQKIPPHWGGTMKGSDEFCTKQSIWMQGPTNRAFFTHDATDYDQGSLTTANISARDSYKVTVKVEKPDSLIMWRLRSQNHDIGFQIICNDDKSVIVPYQRIQSQKQILERSEVCKKAGTYTIIFDNTYSLARSKTIYYAVEIETKTEEVAYDFEESGSEDSEYSDVVDINEIGNNNGSQLMINSTAIVAGN